MNLKISQSSIFGLILLLFVYNNIFSLQKKTEESEETVAFQVLKNVPYPDQCKIHLEDPDEMKNCVTNFIGRHVNKNFKLRKFKNYKPGKYKVIVQFKIDNEGKITDVKARTDNSNAGLEEEAVRVIKKIPQMNPATKNGKNVGVIYGLPINFEIPEKKNKKN